MARTAVSGLVASAASPRADWPNCFKAFRRLSRLRPTTVTLAPLLANAIAAEKPKPVVPPISTIDLPVSSAEDIGNKYVAKISGEQANFGWGLTEPDGILSCAGGNKNRQKNFTFLIDQSGPVVSR